MAGPALRAMIGNVNTTLIDGAMCVMPWNTTWGDRGRCAAVARYRCCWRFRQSREPPLPGADLVPLICAIGFAICELAEHGVNSRDLCHAPRPRLPLCPRMQRVSWPAPVLS